MPDRSAGAAPARPLRGPVRVYLEQGKRWVFVCALDWPGWCRRGRSEELALESLIAYVPRYAAVALFSQRAYLVLQPHDLLLREM